MSRRVEFPTGSFCWADVAARDLQEACAFYGALFGWKPLTIDAGGDTNAALLQLDGDRIVSVSRGPSSKDAPSPPAKWVSYLSVEDIERSTQLAKQAGGTVLAGPFDVLDLGREALVRDPLGAEFSLWQPGGHRGAARINEPCTMCWNELLTSDVDRACEFFKAVFGWNTQPRSEADRSFRCLLGDHPIAGISRSSSPTVNRWLVYFQVESCDSWVEKALVLGAKVQEPTADVAGLGRLGHLVDPQGAVFGLLEPR